MTVFYVPFGTYLNLDFWKEGFGSALGQLWLRPLPILHDANKGSSWTLLVRNWLQSGSLCRQSNPQILSTTDFVDAEVSNHGPRSCFPVHSITQLDLTFQIFYVFPDSAPSPSSHDASKNDAGRAVTFPNA
ncbi:expressed protein [Echinococcus multilocularis]|uniref:Expressed protein n=1 Tax=Echinococcus multilocularis TaxID=6211 RepID=A0A087W2R0_ECHMU|nr:expressed protein [Echinococcus multilocularis]